MNALLHCVLYEAAAENHLEAAASPDCSNLFIYFIVLAFILLSVQYWLELGVL